MSRSKVWRYMGVGLGGAVLGVAGLLATVIFVMPSVIKPHQLSKVSLSDIGCPSGMNEDMAAGACVISPANFTALAYATEGVDGLDLLKHNPSPVDIRQAAHKIENDDQLAFNLYRMAAVLGDAHSQFIVGGLYSNGKGTEENDLEALRWLHESAHNGHRKAQLRLAYMLSKGEFVEKDDVQAILWLTRAKESAPIDTAKAEEI